RAGRLRRAGAVLRRGPGASADPRARAGHRGAGPGRPVAPAGLPAEILRRPAAAAPRRRGARRAWRDGVARAGLRRGAHPGAAREWRAGRLKRSGHGPAGHLIECRPCFRRPPMTLLKFTDVSLAYGAMPLLDGVSWQIARGERVCIIGRDGTGKSSLMQLAKGAQLPDDGEIWRASCHHVSGDGMGVDDQRGMPRGRQERGAGGGWRVQRAVDGGGSRLNLAADKALWELSGGWRGRVLLPRALVAERDPLLLD